MRPLETWLLHPRRRVITAVLFANEQPDFIFVLYYRVISKAYRLVKRYDGIGGIFRCPSFNILFRLDENQVEKCDDLVQKVKDG
jgi:hypothetical protein